MAGVACAGCVIPFGPDFQDPPEGTNSPPEILTSTPALGAVVTVASPKTSAQFSVTITDHNAGDTLFVRWLANYPDYVRGTTLKLEGPRDQYPPSTDGHPWVQQVVNTIDCLDVAPDGLPQHRISFAVADRAFLDQDFKQPLQVPDGGKVIVYTWTLNLSCGAP
jgi:hypothetical protein